MFMVNFCHYIFVVWLLPSRGRRYTGNRGITLPWYDTAVSWTKTGIIFCLRSLSLQYTTSSIIFWFHISGIPMLLQLVSNETCISRMIISWYNRKHPTYPVYMNNVTALLDSRKIILSHAGNCPVYEHVQVAWPLLFIDSYSKNARGICIFQYNRFKFSTSL